MRFALIASLPLLFAACSSQAGNTANASPVQAPATDAATPESESGRPFTMTEMGRFDHPFAMAFLPDGRLLVTEKPGTLRLRMTDGRTFAVAGTPQVHYGNQGGLLDVALAPDFARSGIIYLSYSEPRPHGSSLALARAKLVGADGPTPKLENVQVIWRQGSDGAGGQYGSVIAFSPDGKYLFITSGERQRFTPAQDPNQKLGKILRLTLDGKPAPGNPHAGQTGTPTVEVTDPPRDTEAAKTAPARAEPVDGPNLAPAETWTSGHRNPYGLAFARDGRLWETEMGPKGGDELNLIEPGKNYGWPLVSEGDNYDGKPIPRPSTRPDLQPPVLFWVPSISPGGFMIYSGSMFPQWRGSGFIGALSGESLIRVTIDGAHAAKADRWPLGMRVRDVAQAPDGSIWLLQDGEGRLFRLTPKK